jgi:hypothetical protein
MNQDTFSALVLGALEGFTEFLPKFDWLVGRGPLRESPLPHHDTRRRNVSGDGFLRSPGLKGHPRQRFVDHQRMIIGKQLMG